ncbi:MAG: hypothetical protein M1826_003574 [Phylliscum demangeonii]|nr:MAG: hypothetical protein M1826_003574 [Phylliscum demangeonii]
MPVLLLAALSVLALLRPEPSMSMSTGSGPAPIPAGQRADPGDHREYLGEEGQGDPSSTFIAKCLAQTVTKGIPKIYPPLLEGMIFECQRRGEQQGFLMKEPFSSDWTRYVEFEPFFSCLARQTPFQQHPVMPNSPQHLKDAYARAVARGTSSCGPKLPATIVDRPTLPVVHEAAPGAEHGAEHPLPLLLPLPLPFRHPATKRAGLHPLAWFRRLRPGLLRDMRPAMQRAGAALESRPRVMEY